MKKILIVLTGGTIGSRIEKENIEVTESSPLRILELYRETYGGTEEFEVARPYTILSENLRLTEWTLLARQLWRIPFEAYQGIIVAHGSDTLSYTSALMGMLFAHIPIPLVFTASNYPLGEAESNGLANFRGAVELIKTPYLRGAFTVYRNNKGKMQVYLATRITESDPYTDQFGSFGRKPFGEIREGSFFANEDPVNPGLSELAGERKALSRECPVFENKILLLKAYPGLDYEWIDRSAHPAAVVHYLYHSATACTAGKEESFLRFAKQCREREIPIYTASYKRLEGNFYSTEREMLKQEIIPLENLSVEAAYARVLLAYNLKGVIPRRIAERNIFFEQLPSPSKGKEQRNKQNITK